jgi:hypothetical protein
MSIYTSKVNKMKNRYRALNIIMIAAILTLATTITIIVQALYNAGFYRPVPGGVMVSAGNYYATSSYVVEDQATGTRYLFIVRHLPYYAGTNEIYQPTASSDY